MNLLIRLGSRALLIPLRNVLLAANGCLLLMGIPVLGGSLTIGKIGIAIVLIYLVIDFAYLSLSYPQQKFSECLDLFKHGYLIRRVRER
jgi:hypothetical protein